MSDSKSLIADGIERIFTQTVDRKLLDAFEEGHWPAALWDLVAASGYQRVLDSDGHAAPDWQDAEAVLLALGFYRVPLPLGETLVANWLCARAGLAAADDVATLVDGRKLQLTFDGAAGLTINGSVPRVPWARHCRRLILDGSAGGRPVIAIVEAGAPGLVITPGKNLAGEPRDDVRFDGCRALTFANDDSGFENPVRLYGALLRATTMAGAAASLLDQSVVYVNDRVQFGRPLARFQAIQHMLAELASEAAAATMAAAAACAAAAAPHAPLEIATAKVRAGQMSVKVTRIAHQVHGAIGFTHEHDLHFATRRLWAWRSEFGGDASWAEQIGLAALRAGSAGFWAQCLVT